MGYVLQMLTCGKDNSGEADAANVIYSNMQVRDHDFNRSAEKVEAAGNHQRKIKLQTNGPDPHQGTIL